MEKGKDIKTIMQASIEVGRRLSESGKSLSQQLVEISGRYYNLSERMARPAAAFIVLSKRLQQLRLKEAREYEHCKYSSRLGCNLMKKIARTYFFNRYNQRSYNLNTLEDCQQEAFLAMLENKHKYKEGCPEKFIREVVGNHFKEVFRSANTKARAIDSKKFRGKIKYINPGISVINCTVLNTWEGDYTLTAYIKNKGTPVKGLCATFTFLSEMDKAYLKAELLQDMRQAVQKLPELQRDIINLYYLQGKNIKEICQLLHISTAREQRTRREALKALRLQLFESGNHINFLTMGKSDS